MKQETEALTLEQAQEALERISTHRTQLITRRMSLNDRVEASRHEAAQRYLGGDRGGLEEAGAIEVELQTIEVALGLLDEHQKAAELDLERAKVCDLRERAQQNKAELAKLNSETEMLLVKLGELEGVKFTHYILSSQPVEGAWLQQHTLKAPEPWQGIWELAINVSVQHPNILSPRSRILRMEIEELEAKALSIEHGVSVEEATQAA